MFGITPDWTLGFSFNTSGLLLSFAVVVSLWIIYLFNFERSKVLTDKIPGWKDRLIIGDILDSKRDPLETYRDVLLHIPINRKHKIHRYRCAIWAVICLFTPDEIETLLRSNVYIDKSDYYDFMQPWLGLGLLTSSGTKWKTRRRMLTPSFHFNILKDFLSVMNNHASGLKEKLHQDGCDEKSDFDVFPYITLSALDMICDTAMGINMNGLHHGDSEYVKAVYLVKDAIAVRQRTPWYWPDFIYHCLPIGRAVKEATALMHQYAYKVIRERREMKGDLEYSSKHKAFLDLLLECKDESGNGLTDEDIREEVDTFMFEGHDTMSAATAHAVHLLGSNLDVQQRCQLELDELIDSPRDFTMDDLSKMTYLEWCIKESLRLYPSVPWFGRELPEDTDFAGYTVPKGTTVAVFPCVLHRDPEIYPDPEKFDPTRFSPENSAKRHPYAYIPFSAGPRNCIGRRFAMMELKVILATLLLNFNIKSTQTRDELKTNPGLVLQPSNGIRVKLTSRV